jgi:hypothetical protein
VRLSSRRMMPVGRMRRPWKCLPTAPLPPWQSLRWTEAVAMRLHCGSRAGPNPTQCHNDHIRGHVRLNLGPKTRASVVERRRNGFSFIWRR